MKPLCPMLALAVALAFAACDKVPQPKRIQATNEIEMDLLVVRLAEDRAVTLIPKLRDPRRAAGATKEVLKFVESREATLVGWPFLASKSGQRAVFEQVDEFRYATEYDPPGITKMTEKQKADSSAPDSAVVSVDPAAPPVVQASASSKTIETTHDPMPQSFQTRNLGVTLEVEPNISRDGRTIDLNLVPQHIRLRGMRKVTVEGPKEGQKVVVEQPEVVTHKVTTSISVQDGDYTLLGVFNVPDMPGQTELFILHTRIKRIEVPADEPPPGSVAGANASDADLSSPASPGRE